MKPIDTPAQADLFPLTDAERYVLSRVRHDEPLSWMHRRVLWGLAARGVQVVLCP